MTNFPQKIEVQLLNNKTNAPVKNVALYMTLFASRKNDYGLLFLNTDGNGKTSISKKHIEGEIRCERNLFLMDYASTLEDCKPYVEIKVLNDEEIMRMYRSANHYNQRKNHPGKYVLLEQAENYKYVSEKFIIPISEGVQTQSIQLSIKEKGVRRRGKTDEEKTKLFVLAGLGAYEDFVAAFQPKYLNNKNRFGIGLLHAAIAERKFDIAHFLIDKSIDVNMTDYDGLTALHYICFYPDLEVAKAIIRKGGDMNIKDKYGNTAFLMSVIYFSDENYEIVRLFSENQPILSANSAGLTLLEIAKNTRDEKLISILQNIK